MSPIGARNNENEVPYQGFVRDISSSWMACLLCGEMVSGPALVSLCLAAIYSWSCRVLMELGARGRGGWLRGGCGVAVVMMIDRSRVKSTATLTRSPRGAGPSETGSRSKLRVFGGAEGARANAGVEGPSNNKLGSRSRTPNPKNGLR